MSTEHSHSRLQSNLRNDQMGLNPAVIDKAIELIDSESNLELTQLLAELHTADAASLIEQIPTALRRRLISMIGNSLDPGVLSELAEGVRDDVIGQMEPSRLAAAVRQLDTDDIVYLVEDLDSERQEAALAALERADRTAIRQSLQYPEDTAGRLMQRELISLPPYYTAEQTIEAIRLSENLPQAFYEIIVVNPSYQPIGVVPLSRVITSDPSIPLSNLMNEDFTCLRTDQQEADIAFVFNHYHLLSAPIVDEDGRLVGMITIDDAVEIMEGEAQEDLLHMGGVHHQEEISDSILTTVGRRISWLFINLWTAFAATFAISVFSSSIQQLVVLAALMPVVASMGGNAGTQTLTVSIRALAEKTLTSANAWRVVWREVVVGGINGLFFAIFVGILVGAFFHNAILGCVIGAALAINLTIAGLFGIIIPLGIKKIGWDPALASGVFLTTLTDVVGFTAFLALATLFLL